MSNLFKAGIVFLLFFGLFAILRCILIGDCYEFEERYYKNH